MSISFKRKSFKRNGAAPGEKEIVRDYFSFENSEMKIVDALVDDDIRKQHAKEYAAFVESLNKEVIQESPVVAKASKSKKSVKE